MVLGQRVEPASQKLGNVLLHQIHFGLLIQELDHGRILAGELAQVGFVMRIGQHAHVEHIVGIHRHAAFEGERLKHQNHAARRHRHQALHVALQLRGPNRAGVDHMRLLAQLSQQFTLQLDGLEQGVLTVTQFVLGQRMAAACFGEATHQSLGRRVEKQALHAHVLLAQCLELLWHQRQRGRTAHVDRNRQPIAVIHVLQRDKRGQQFRRQIVDTVKTCVFQGPQCHGFSRTGHTGDKHNFKRHSPHHKPKIEEPMISLKLSTAAASVDRRLRQIQHFPRVRERRCGQFLSAQHTGNFLYACVGLCLLD